MQFCHDYPFTLFQHANAKVLKQSVLQVEPAGFKCSCLRSGLRDSIADSEGSRFDIGLTRVLITTDIMACNIHIMQKVSVVCYLRSSWLKLLASSR